MSLHSNLANLNNEALRETLEAAEMLINYRKSADKEKWDTDAEGCLGYPAAILLFSYIEAVGCIYMGGKTGNSFKVLKEPLFESQHISENLCRQLYEVYRNKITHNLALPKNAYLINKPESSDVFDISNTGKNGQAEIANVNINALLTLCKKSLASLPQAFKEKLESSKVKEDLDHKNLRNPRTPSITDNPSGYC